ncbi:hypothetical protein HRW12_00490 [Streptomyces lunaelactis]|nr:hypothetical protein [Streptomyces lunaelactis]NUK41201.1 hypothetical protein [Streptomyces lunaelactis]
MKVAIELSLQSPLAEGAFSVGAVIVDENGDEVAHGYPREGGDLHVHAEEAALAKVAQESRLLGGTIYSTLEPCSQRKSRPLSCTQHILQSGLARVVIAWREPSLFVHDCQGVEILTAPGATVIEIPELADPARQANSTFRGSALDRSFDGQPVPDGGDLLAQCSEEEPFEAFEETGVVVKTIYLLSSSRVDLAPQRIAGQAGNWNLA